MRKSTGIFALLTVAGPAAIVALSILVNPFSAEAQSAPSFPHIFFGSVTIAGKPAEPGLVIEARIDNVNYAQSITNGLATSQPVVDAIGGTYGTGNEFRVCSDNLDTPEMKEGGVNGDTIEFFIQIGNSWFKAETSVSPITFRQLDVTRLDLTVANLNISSTRSTTAESACSLPAMPATSTPTSRPFFVGSFPSSSSSNRNDNRVVVPPTSTKTPTPLATSTAMPQPSSTPTPEDSISTQTGNETTEDTPTPIPTETPSTQMDAPQSTTATPTPTPDVVVASRASLRDIVMLGSIEQAISAIEQFAAHEAATLLAAMPSHRATAILNGVSSQEAAAIVELISENALLEILPYLSPEVYWGLPAQLLLAKMRNVPADFLVQLKTPTVKFPYNAPKSTQVPPNKVEFTIPKVEPFEWVRLTGSRRSSEGVLGKFQNELTDLTVTRENFTKLPESLQSLEKDRIFHSGFNLDVESIQSQELAAGFITFLIESSWMRSNRIHKWSIRLDRFDEQSLTWIPSLAVPTHEDDGSIHFGAVVPQFSTFVITGSERPSFSGVEVSEVDISPVVALSNEPVTVNAIFQNTGARKIIHVASLWVNDIVETSKEITLDTGESIAVEYSVQKPQGTYDVRVGRQFDRFVVLPSDESAEMTPTPTSFVSPSRAESANDTRTPVTPLNLGSPPPNDFSIVFIFAIGAIVLAVIVITLIQVVRMRQ